MARPVLHTPRIELRPMTLAHLPLLHQLDTDAEVMRYLLGRPRTPKEIDAFWTPRCADTTADTYGLGWWVGFVDGEGGREFVGWWDLGRSDSEPASAPRPDEAEIGWRVLRHRWREGLASEGARALLRYGFETVGLERVWARTMAVNAGSIGVMRSIGMRHVRTDPHAGPDPLPGCEQGEVTYEITAAQWRMLADDATR